MKKLVTLFLAAGMLLTSVAGASAIEFRPSGEINVGFFGSNTFLGSKANFQDNDSWEANTGDDSYEPKRYHFMMDYALNLDFIANEQLSGRIGFQGRDKHFGANNDWNDAFIVKTAYIDWYVPNTPVQVRLGRWNQGTMFFTGTLQMLSPVAAQDGVRVSAKINDNVTLTGIWWRRADGREDGVGSYDNYYADQFYLEAPLTFDGIRANIWGTYIRDQHSFALDEDELMTPGVFGPGSAPYGVPFNTAKFATLNDGDITSDTFDDLDWNHSRVFAFGAGISISKFSPFVFAADFGYSNLEVDGVDFDLTGGDAVNAPNAFDRKGWYLSGRVSYNTAYGTPSLLGWYTSGDDDNLSNGSERPLFAGTGLTGTYALFKSTSVSGLQLGPETARFFTMVGNWGLSAQWSRISFVDGLNHSVALSYIKGTNDPFMARFQAAAAPYSYMTNKDSAIALELNNSYQIYKELTMAFDMFYIWQNFDGALWNKIVDVDNPDTVKARFNTIDDEVEFSNAWGIGLSFHYAF